MDYLGPGLVLALNAISASLFVILVLRLLSAIRLTGDHRLAAAAVGASLLAAALLTEGLSLCARGYWYPGRGWGWGRRYWPRASHAPASHLLYILSYAFLLGSYISPPGVVGVTALLVPLEAGAAAMAGAVALSAWRRGASAPVVVGYALLAASHLIHMVLPGGDLTVALVRSLAALVLAVSPLRVRG